MKIVVDSAIPYIKGVLEPYAEVIYCPGQMIDNRVVETCDAMIIRTRTRCDAKLLEASAVGFIATATIGTDHIDLAWCKARGIEVKSAAGCNARGVLQWVAAVLRAITAEDNKRPESYTLGIVGVGNVGSLVARYGRAWGFNILECDPPREKREGGNFVDLEHIVAHSDIITLHTPLDDTTHHLIGRSELAAMHPATTIINASRGGVVDNRAVADSRHRYIFDVWEGEPQLPHDILQGATLATPHIAGYSQQGKANATSMAVRALARHFALPLTEWYPEGVKRSAEADISWDEMCGTINDYFAIREQSDALKAHPERFEQMRDNYVYREEYF